MEEKASFTSFIKFKNSLLLTSINDKKANFGALLEKQFQPFEVNLIKPTS